MRAMTGRAVSAAIHQRLKDALAQGEPLTYRQLADHAGCTERSVRNYLARAEDIFGFPVKRSRDETHRVVVRALDPPKTNAASPHEPSPDAFGSALARALFPADDEANHAHDSVTVALRGLPSYGVHQARIARHWAKTSLPKDNATALCLLLEHKPGKVVLWPMAVLVHSDAGVVLVGAPPGAQSPEEVVSLPLASVRDEPDAMQALQDADVPAFDHEAVALDALIDLPFCGLRADPRTPMVDVHVRFEPALAPRLARRVWHRTQRLLLRRDGELDVRFGPVPLAAAASWAAGFGDGIRVLGDKKLRKAVKKRSFVP